MQNMVQVIQAILGFQENGKEVLIELADNTSISGAIESFSGKSAVVGGKEILLENIVSVKEKVAFDPAALLMNRATISVVSDGEVTTADGVVISCDAVKLTYITSSGQQEAELKDITRITLSDGNEVYSREIASDVPDKIDETAGDTAEETARESAADTDGDDTGDDEAERMNPFEQAVIYGETLVVSDYIRGRKSLAQEGYSDDEIARIQKVKLEVPWGQEPIKIAQRIYIYQKNKNDLAKEYYAAALDSYNRGTNEYIEAVNSLFPLVTDNNEFLKLWRKNHKYITNKKAAAYFEKEYLRRALELAEIEPNIFEQKVIEADRDAALVMINDGTLEKLGYSEAEIQRARNAFKAVTWDTSWYKTAARLFSLQINKNGLTEVFYEAALVATDKKSSEYTKALNSLASIKISVGAKAFSAFFNSHRERLKNNESYCIAYANALVELQDWKRLSKELPFLHEQITENPAVLEKYEEEVRYYETMPEFNISHITPVYERYLALLSTERFAIEAGEEIDPEISAEKNLIAGLPSRVALKSLLELYRKKEEETAFFALAEYAMAYIKEDKASMKELLFMLKACSNDAYITKFLPSVPVFWGETDLLKRYVDATHDDISENSRLDRHIASLGAVKPLNSFELCIINCDYDGVVKFLDSPKLLEDLGYTEEQIEEMKALNIEDYTSPEMYTMRRILAFQGDTNRTAERFLFDAFYDNKVDMCNRLFPLLLAEDRGDMILELYAFDRSLNRSTAAFRRSYLLALCVAEDDDDIFFDQASSEWTNFPEEKIIDRLLRIAEERNDEFLKRSLELQKSKPQGNDFEIAVMELNTESIRNYVKNAEMLVELGYTPEEISRISKIFLNNSFSAGTKPGQIANRVYLFQKNKNNLAEKLYFSAITEDSSSDVTGNVRVLYQIYQSQRNYEMVCKLYEEYLTEEAVKTFNSSDASVYCNALFELEKYEKFLGFIKEKKDGWQNFGLSQLLLYVDELLDDHELDDFVMSKIKANAYRPEIIGAYLQHAAAPNASTVYSPTFMRILNMYFLYLSDEDLKQLRKEMAGLDLGKFNLPEGALIHALAGRDNDGMIIIGWLDYIKSEIEYDPDTLVDLMIKLTEQFSESKSFIVERLLSIYHHGLEEGLTEAKRAELEKFFDSSIDIEEQKAKWSATKKELLISGNGSASVFMSYLREACETESFDTTRSIYLRYRDQFETDGNYQSSFEMLRLIYDAYSGSIESSERLWIVDEMIGLCGKLDLDYSTCRAMSDLCLESGREFEARIFRDSALKIVPESLQKEETEATNNITDWDSGFIENMIRILDEENYYKSVDKWKGLSRYIDLSDEEKIVTEQLRNTINLSNQWTTAEVNTLAKAIFSEPNNTVYWKLFQAWISRRPEETQNVKANILFHLSSGGEREKEIALDLAVAEGIKSMALDLALEMLGEGDHGLNIHAQKKLREMADLGWLSDGIFRERVPQMINIINENTALYDSEEYIWNSVGIAADIAVASGEYKVFIDSFKGYLSRECAKQGTAVLAAMMLDGNTDYADAVIECINSSYADNPYRELVEDLYQSYKIRDISEAEKQVLRVVKANDGNALGVESLFSFYCDMHYEGKCDIGLEAVKIMMKHMSFDPVLPEIAASFLKSSNEPDKLLQLYDYLYDYINITPTDKPVQYAVGQLICGENYFRQIGKEVRSFRKLIDERYPVYSELARNYQEFCDCITVGLRSTGSEEFAQILFAAVLCGDWTPVFEYKPEDVTVETVLEENISSSRVNVAYEYYRSIISSVAVFLIRHDDIMDAAKASTRMRFLWSQISNVGCSIDFFSEAIQMVDADYIPELINIWTLDIETLSVFKKQFGRYILQQPNCYKYYKIFNVFTNARGSDIFLSQESKQYIRSIDISRAIEIAEAYESLYLRCTGPAVSETTGITYTQDSNYERNTFSNFLRKADPQYMEYEKRAARFKRKYEMICQIHGLRNGMNINKPSVEINTKLQLFAIRALYYYYSILSDSVDSNVFSENSYADIINAIVVAVSDDAFFANLNDLIARLDDEEKTILGILLMSERQNLDEAAAIALGLENNRFKAHICSRLYVEYGKKTSKNKERLREITRKSRIPNFFWIRNYKRATGLKKIDPSVYLTEHIQASDNHKESVITQVKAAAAVDSETRLSNEEIITSSAVVDNFDESDSDIPQFIAELLESPIEDKALNDLIGRWKSRKEQVEDRVDDLGAQAALNGLSIDIGVYLIHRNKSNIREDVLEQLFNLIKPNSVSKYQFAGLMDVFQAYICSYTDLDLMAKSVYDLRDAIRHLGNEQILNEEMDKRAATDMHATKAFIEILTNISMDLYSAMSDDSVKERLYEYQKELYNRTRDKSRLRNASNAVYRMIQGKINSLNSVPRLVISHYGTYSEVNNEPVLWSEGWFPDAEKGYIRGVVSNIGGAPAMNVNLSVSLESGKRETFKLDKIAAGKKVPFCVPYDKTDIVDDKVAWNATVNFTAGGKYIMNAHCMGAVKVYFAKSEWNNVRIGREKFNPQAAATGEDFYGRTNELMRINSLYNPNIPIDRYPSLLITGLRRAGKSSMIKRFKSELEGRSDLAPIFVDAQSIAGDITKAFFGLVFLDLYINYRKEVTGLAEFKKKWEEVARSEDWVGYLPEYFIELSELLGGRKIIFIMDEMENVFYSDLFGGTQKEEQFFGMIRSIIQNYQNFVSFIFCGSDKLLTSCLEQRRESQMFQVLQRMYIGRMSINDIREMFYKYNEEFTISKFNDDAIDRIMYYTNGLIWYTKVIAFNILDKIIDSEHIKRDAVHPMDVDSVVEMLVSGDLGSELTDLLDNNFGSKRKAIARAMARATSSREDSVNAEVIAAELAKLNFVDPDTGEVLGTVPLDEINRNLGILEKMDFIEKDPQRDQSYRFTTEIYRLLMLSRRRIDKFIAEK